MYSRFVRNATGEFPALEEFLFLDW